MESYLTVAGESSDFFVEKKSKFIGSIAPVSSKEEAEVFIEKVRAAHKDARHNVFAYSLKSGGYQRYSDDGEPSGTGGPPVLEVINRRELLDCCVVVTRYFGGVLLGAGGLTRAYATGAKLAIDSAKIVQVRRCVRIRVPLSYSDYQIFLAAAGDFPLSVEDSHFEDEVVLTLKVLKSYEEEIRGYFENLSRGKVKIEDLGELFSFID